MKNNILILLILLAFSCNKIVTKENDEIDLKEAKIVTNDFYNEIISKDTLSVIKNLDKTIDEKEFIDLIVSNYKDFGKITEFNISSVNTKSIEKNNSILIEYKISINVKYENKSCIEYLMFTSENNEKPLLNKYLINPEN